MSKENESKEDRLVPASENEEPKWRKFAPKPSFAQEIFVNEVKTQLPIARRPRVKITFAGLLCGTLVGCLGLIYQLYSAFSAKAPQEMTQSITQASDPAQMSEQEKMQFDRSYYQIQRLDNLKNRVPTTSTAQLQKFTTSIKPKTTLQAVPVSLPVSRTETFPQLHNRPRSTSRLVRKYQSRSDRNFGKGEITLPIPKNQVSRSVLPSPSLTLLTDSENYIEDPMNALRQIAKAGIYSSDPAALSPSNTTMQMTQQEPLTQMVSSPIEVENSSYTSAPSSVVPVTTRIEGQVLTPVSWVGSASEEPFRIQINEDLKAENGAIVLAQNSQLLARVLQSNINGYLNIQIISLIVEGQERSISPDTIFVKGKNGLPLKAKVKKNRPGFLERMGSEVLSAGVDGAADAVSNSISGGGKYRVQQVFRGSLRDLEGQGSSIDQTVFVLKEGTKLELLINKPLSL